jgi:site-specific recombinase XerC
VNGEPVRHRALQRDRLDRVEVAGSAPARARDFADRRDAAILRLFLDTGARVSEAAGTMLPGDLDLDDQVIIVLGKAAGPGRSRSARKGSRRLA